MKIHYKKILPQYFNDVVNGNKPFELRLNNCNYEVGDRLVLKEFKPKINEEYTGREISKEITYVFKGGQFGIDKDYCILGLKQDNKEKDIYLKAINTFGQHQQMIKTIEECNELGTVLAQTFTKPDDVPLGDILTEIADVEIMIQQLRIIFGDDAVDQYKDKKLKRLEGVVY